MKKITLTGSIFIFYALTSYSQLAEKQIENFSTSPNDAQRFICGMNFISDGCWVCPSTVASHSSETIDPAEGTESIRLTYTTIGGSGINEYMRILPSGSTVNKYYFSDLGYAPSGLSIQIKGEIGNTDKFRLMLIEDINLDLNIWDNEKAFFYTNDTVLGNPYWQTITIPYAAFSPLTTGTLDPKRIRGYTLDVLNTSSTAHSGSVCFDDLRQLTTAIPEKDSTAMAGTFMLYNDFMDNWTSDQWRAQINLMKDACMKKIILQFTQSGTTSYYSTPSGSWIVTEKSIVDSIVKAAELEEFNVVFGLSTNSACDITSPDATACNEELVRNQSIVDDLFNQFGNSPAFEGWYITKEFWDAINVQDSTFTEYYAQLSTYCKSYDTTKSVSIAPAIFLNYPADVYANWINDFLSNCPAIDIVYFQDMGGRLITDADVDLPHYFDLLKTVCEAQGKQFGVDIETFHELNTCDGILYNYRTKTLEELKQQLYTASIFSDEIVNYCWQYFYLYDNQLYTDYKDWVADFSECQEPTLSLNTDIEDLISHIYPNPVSHTLTLQIPELTSEPHSLLVIDISGKVVFEGLLTANRLDVSMLTPGVYLLKIATKENQKYMYRFVKY